MERLAGEPLVLVPHAVEPLLYRYLVSDVLGRSRVAPSVVLEATTLESACSAVAARLGVAFVAEALTQVLALPGVVYRPFAPPAPLSKLGVAWRQDATSNTVRWFLEVLDELAAGAVDQGRAPAGPGGQRRSGDMSMHAGIVLAAGAGTRVGNSRNKVYLPLGGRRIVTWSLELFRQVPSIGRLVLVVRDNDRELVGEILDREFPDVPVDVVTGGETRHESEYRALLHLADDIRRGEIDIVLVHDAARPLTPVRVVEEVLATAMRTGGAIPALPLEDVAGVDEAGRISESDRTDLIRVQTPQAFRSSQLLAAYEAAASDGFAGTDTASCVERYEGVAVHVVAGDPRNLKVTYADDLFMAELMLAASGYKR